MAPWAGRTRRGRFSFDGVDYVLERNSGDHAIHGTVRGRPWEVTEQSDNRVALRCDFGPGWPFAGWAEQVLAARPDGLDLELSMHAAAGRMPAAGGWPPARRAADGRRPGVGGGPPWWRRGLARGDAAELDLPAGSMYVRDDEGIAIDE